MCCRGVSIWRTQKNPQLFHKQHWQAKVIYPVFQWSTKGEKQEHKNITSTTVNDSQKLYVFQVKKMQHLSDQLFFNILFTRQTI